TGTRARAAPRGRGGGDLPRAPVARARAESRARLGGTHALFGESARPCVRTRARLWLRRRRRANRRRGAAPRAGGGVSPAGHARPGSEAFAAFRAGVARRVLDLGPRALLRRTCEREDPPGDEDDRKQRGNKRLMAEGEVGRLRPINCLEAALVAYQAERVPMI